MMLKQNKWKILISSLVVLFPMILGLLFWDRLDAEVVIHWGIDGKPDGMGSRTLAVVGLPLILLAVHWLCLGITAWDPGQRNQNRKALGMVFWIMPFVSLLVSGLFYSFAMGKTMNPVLLLSLLMGFLFICIGNYLPKCKQNYTLGIKVKWTLQNEENWNATHRFAGRLWVAGGLLFLLSALLPQKIAMVTLFILLFVFVFSPMVYSWRYYKKQLKKGPVPMTSLKPLPKWVKWLSALFLTAILVFVAVIMFTGDISCRFDENSFTVEASYYEDLTLRYDEIDAVEYREASMKGTRTFGFESARLQMGRYSNEEFGAYTRYTYVGSDSCVVLTVGERVLVLSGKDPAGTGAIYETLLEKIK